MMEPPKEPGNTHRSRIERRRLISEIQAVLQSFDKAKEWADLNNALHRLQKCISKPILSYIPHKEIVCKRLAQCLNPHLPSGVHTRTLEVYASILHKIGTSGLIKDLALFSSGLFPFFSYSATSIRPIFLDIIESFYIPLGKQLIPCLVGLLLCILPGLEDDKSDYFNKVHEILNRICDCVSEVHFMWALWTILLKASKIRYLTLQVIALRLAPGVPSHSSERLKILLPKRETLVLNALIASFRDECPLVMRSLSDMLVNHFPLDWPVLTKPERIALIKCTLVLVNKAEWSFIRSLYKWLFNISHEFVSMIHTSETLDELDDFNEETNDEGLDLEYFCKYVKDDFIEAVKELLQIKPTTIDEVREPIKMIVTLVSDIDLHGFANEVMPDLSLSILQYISCEFDEDEWRVDVVNRAKMIFDPTLTPPRVIFEAIGKGFKELVQTNNLNSNGDWDELLQLLYIYIEQLISNSKYLITGLRGLLNQALTSLHTITIDEDILINILMLIKDILQKIENSVLNSGVFKGDCDVESVFSESMELRNSVIYFLQHYYKNALEKFRNLSIIDDKIGLLDLLNQLAINITRLSHLGLDGHGTQTWISTLVTCCLSENIIFSSCSSRTLIEIMKVDGRIRELLTNNNDIYKISGHLYNMLGSMYESSHYEIVLLMLELHEVCMSSPSEVERTLGESLSCTKSVSKMEAIARFSVVWKYSHIHFPNYPVFPETVGLVLDFVTDQDPHIRYHARSFLSDAVMHLPHVIDNIIINLAFKANGSQKSTRYFQRADGRSNLPLDYTSSVQYPSLEGVDEVVRMFKHLSSILTCEGQSAAEAMQVSILSKDLLDAIEGYKMLKMPSKINSGFEPVPLASTSDSAEGKSMFPQLIDVNNDSYDDECVFDYVDLLVITALNYICINVDVSYLMQTVTVGNLKRMHAGSGDEDLKRSILECSAPSDNEEALTVFRCTAIEFLKLFLSTIQPAARAKEVCCMISRPLVCMLLYFYMQRETVVQTQLLLLLKVVLYKSHLPGPCISNYTRNLISALHNKSAESDLELKEFNHSNASAGCNFTGRFRLRDDMYESGDRVMDMALDAHIPDGISNIFVKVISAKERKVSSIRNMGNNVIFGFVLRFCACNSNVITADLLNSHVEFSLLSLRYMPSGRLCAFISIFMDEFCLQLKNNREKIGIEGAIIYLRGLLDLCGYISDIVSQNHGRTERSWKSDRRVARGSVKLPGSLARAASVSKTISSCSFVDCDADEFSDSFELSSFKIWDVVDSCVQFLVYLEYEKGSGDEGGEVGFQRSRHSHAQSAFIRTKGAEAVESQVLSIFNLLYKKLPFYFTEGCMATWDKCFAKDIRAVGDGAEGRFSNSFKVRRAMLDVLKSMQDVDLFKLCSYMLDMYENYCKSDEFKNCSHGVYLMSCMVRESSIMDFLHELLIFKAAEIPEMSEQSELAAQVPSRGLSLSSYRLYSGSFASDQGKNASNGTDVNHCSVIMSLVDRVASLILHYRRQPVMAIWGLHLYLSIDKLTVIRGIHLENKHVRKRISTLVLHVLMGGTKNFHKSGYSLSPALFDLEPPLPLYLEQLNGHLDQPMAYLDLTTDRQVDRSPRFVDAKCDEPLLPITEDELTLIKIDKLARNCLCQLFMFCYDICHLKRTSPLAGIVLRVICENLATYVVPAMMRKDLKNDLFAPSLGLNLDEMRISGSPRGNASLLSPAVKKFYPKGDRGIIGANGAKPENYLMPNSHASARTLEDPHSDHLSDSNLSGVSRQHYGQQNKKKGGAPGIINHSKSFPNRSLKDAPSYSHFGKEPPFTDNASSAINQWNYKYMILLLVRHLPFKFYRPYFYSMRQHILDYVNSPGFFQVDRRSLLCLMKLVNIIVQEDVKEEKGIIKLDNFVVPYSTSVFSIKVNDLQQRRNYLKRLSFVIYSCEKDMFASHISKILERLTDSIRFLEIDKTSSDDDGIVLHAQIMLAMRILLLKMSQGYLTVLWPVLLSELIKVFDKIKLKLALRCSNATSEQESQRLYTTSDTILLVEAVKTINVACSLRLYDFIIFQWIFVPCEVVEHDGYESADIAFTDNVKIKPRKGQKNKPLVDKKGVKIDETYIEQNFLPFYTIINHLFQSKDDASIEATYHLSRAIALGLNVNHVNLAQINKQVENDLMELSADVVDLYPELSIHAIYKIYHKNTLRPMN